MLPHREVPSQAEAGLNLAANTAERDRCGVGAERWGLDPHLVVLVGEAPYLALAGQDEDVSLGEADEVVADLPNTLAAVGLQAVEPYEDPGKQAYGKDATENLDDGVVQNSSNRASDE